MTLNGKEQRFWRQASISIGAPLGNLEGGLSTGDFDRRIKGALGMGRLSLKRLTAEGSFYWAPWVMKGGLWGQVSLFSWATWSGLVYRGL